MACSNLKQPLVKTNKQTTSQKKNNNNRGKKFSSIVHHLPISNMVYLYDVSFITAIQYDGVPQHRVLWLAKRNVLSCKNPCPSYNKRAEAIVSKNFLPLLSFTRTQLDCFIFTQTIIYMRC